MSTTILNTPRPIFILYLNLCFAAICSLGFKYSVPVRDALLACQPNTMPDTEYKDIVLEITGKIGIIKVRTSTRIGQREPVNRLQFNRPNALNSFGGKLLSETINALRELNEHPDTIFTVLTGEGRFFSAGADIRGTSTIRNNPGHDEELMASYVLSRK